MKFKYCFTLAVILMVLFSLATVVAGENVTDSESLAADVDIDEDLGESENQNTMMDTRPSDEGETDLSVVASVENIYHDDKFNRAGYKVPWTITPKVNGTTAKDVKIHAAFSDNMEIVSATPSHGVFDNVTGIWDIGDLSGSDNASLLIVTKLKEDGRFNLTVSAETSSKDINLSNNDAFLKIKSGTGKKPSNTTKTSDMSTTDMSNRFGDDGSPGSDPNNPFVVVEPDREPSSPSNPQNPAPGGGDESPPDENPVSPYGGNQNGNSKDPKKGSGSGKKGGSGSESGGGGSSGNEGNSNSNDDNGESENNLKSVTKSTNPVVQAISDTLNGLSEIFDMGGDDSDSKGNLSPSVVKAIAAQDYTKIPILIFVAFLIILASCVGYDKIKS